jgi:hypothetical protein
MTPVPSGGLFEYTRRPIFVSASVRLGNHFHTIRDGAVWHHSTQLNDDVQ